MRARDIQIGTRVEITAYPFKGRTGTIRGRSMAMGLVLTWEVWCDNPDFLGRQLVRVNSGGLRPFEDRKGAVHDHGHSVRGLSDTAR